jgi:hypothetical protein
MTFKIELVLLAVICMSSGCAKMLPYSDTYACPQMENGQCVSVEAAYEYASVGATPGSGNAESVPDSREALGDAIEKYRKAVLKDEAEAIEQRQNELLRIINPGQANEFAQALEQFKEAVKAGESKKFPRLSGICTRSMRGPFSMPRIPRVLSTTSPAKPRGRNFWADTRRARKLRPCCCLR